MEENSGIWRFSGCNCDVCRNVSNLEEGHLVTQHTCETCRFFCTGFITGMCRRHSPTEKGWPQTIKMAWCGDWEKK